MENVKLKYKFGRKIGIILRKYRNVWYNTIIIVNLEYNYGLK